MDLTGSRLAIQSLIVITLFVSNDQKTEACRNTQMRTRRVPSVPISKRVFPIHRNNCFNVHQ